MIIRMHDHRVDVRQLRRSTRIPLRLSIRTVRSEGPNCNAETITVNLHGALVRTSLPLIVGETVELEVLITAKKVRAEVVWCDPEETFTYGRIAVSLGHFLKRVLYPITHPLPLFAYGRGDV
jgi:hypothetical protein